MSVEMSEILKENIRLLNIKYKPLDIRFELQGNIISIIENFVISKNPPLKQTLKDKYVMIWNNDQKKWFIGKAGIKILSSKIIKTKPSKSIEVLVGELADYIKIIEEPELRNSINSFMKKNRDFLKAPGARYNHHDYIGGLLEHTIQTVKLALAVSDTTENLIIDRDILISGSILHDVGKINCYEFSQGTIELTDIFKEQEHIINGVKIISQEIKSEKLNDLIHILASHHNIKDWGSPIEPVSNEAWIIHTVENLSSKIMG